MDKKAIANIEATIARYPKIGFLAFVAMISEVIPKAGKRTMYTSGCPRNQKRCSYKTGDPP